MINDAGEVVLAGGIRLVRTDGGPPPDLTVTTVVFWAECQCGFVTRDEQGWANHKDAHCEVWPNG